jgi:hypothetical protein
MTVSKTFAFLLAASTATAAQASSTVLVMACRNGPTEYRLVYDGPEGTLSSIYGKVETKFVLRSLIEEGGSVHIKGYVGRGTDFEFRFRYEPKMTYFYANGGKRNDECKLISRSK